MASPRLEAFPLYAPTTGNPLAGQLGAMSFVTYTDDLGNAIIPPALVEIGGGWYKFTPTFADSARGIVYTIDCGAGASPTKVARHMRPEDWNADYIPTVQGLVQALKDFEQGKWEIPTSGVLANYLIVYAPDGTTILKQYRLLDSAGNPTVSDVFQRVPA